MPRPRSLTSLCAAAAALLLAPMAFADVVTLVCDRDNTLIEDASEVNSNGAGDGFFVGRINLGTLRRGVVRFNLGSIPAGSTITDVRLTMSMTQTNTLTHPVSLHRCLADWGEGTSSSTGGLGAPATPGDATWQHRFFPGVLWAAEGGDYTPVASATTPVTAVGFYTWSSPAMVADAQTWLVGGSSVNFGWVVVGDESGGRTAKKFGSREAPLQADWPRLEVTYSPPSTGCPVDWDDNTQVQPSDVAAFVTDWFTSLTQGTLQGDFDGNQAVEPADVATFVGEWFAAVTSGAC